MHDSTNLNDSFLNETRYFSGNTGEGVFGLSSGLGFLAQDSGLSSGSVSSAHSLGLVMRLASRGGVYLAGGRRYAAAAALAAVVGLAAPAGHALDVSGAGIISSGLTVDGGGNSANNPMSVYSGGVAVNTSLGSGGRQYVFNDGVANYTSIGSGGNQYVYGGGVASGTTLLSPGASQRISSGGVAYDTTIIGGGQYVFDSGVASVTNISSGGAQTVSSGGTAISTNLNSLANQLVFNDGVASETSIGAWGAQYIYSGGSAIGTTISGTSARQYINPNGVASGTSIGSGGTQYLYSGASAIGTSIGSGGTQFISSNAVAIDTNISGSGARQSIFNGGVASNTNIISSGYQSIYNGGLAIGTSISYLGVQIIFNGGRASDTILANTGLQAIFAGGIAIGTVIVDGGQQLISGGVASNTIIDSGGRQYVYSGGVASDTTVSSDGWQVIFSGARASNTFITAGGYQYVVTGGLAINTIIGAGGVQYIYNSGVASATSIGAGGILWCQFGGSVVGIVNPVEGALLGLGAITGNVTIASGGFMAPGSAYDSGSTDAYGSMTIAGNLTLSSGAIYQIRMDGSGNHDAVIVTGSANVTGAVFNHVAVTGANGDDYANTSAMVMSAGGGVTGTFGSATTTLAFYDARLDYSIANQLWLGFARSMEFTDYGGTFNQNSVAGGLCVLETLDPSNPLVQALLGLNEDEVDRVYDQLSGEMHRSLAGGLMLLDRDFTHAVLNRAGGKSRTGSILAASAPTFAAARAFASIHPRALDPRFGDNIWANVGYARQSIDGDGNAGRFTLKGPEFTLGYDHTAPSGWLGGLALRYANRDMEVNSRFSDADVDSYSAALYGGFQAAIGPGAARLVLGGAYSRHEIEGRRGVVIGTNLQRIRSDYHANSYQLFLEGAYAVPVGMVRLEPFADLAWTSLRVPGFVETGGNAALRSHSYSQNNLSQLFGLRLALPDLCRVNLEAQAGWRHTYGKLDKASSFSFVGGGGRFGIKGSTLNRDEAVFDLRAACQVRDNLRVGLEVGAAAGKRGSNVRGGAFIALEW